MRAGKRVAVDIVLDRVREEKNQFSNRGDGDKRWYIITSTDTELRAKKRQYFTINVRRTRLSEASRSAQKGRHGFCTYFLAGCPPL